jgi:hypothetical protein
MVLRWAAIASRGRAQLFDNMGDHLPLRLLGERAMRGRVEAPARAGRSEGLAHRASPWGVPLALLATIVRGAPPRDEVDGGGLGVGAAPPNQNPVRNLLKNRAQSQKALRLPQPLAAGCRSAASFRTSVMTMAPSAFLPRGAERNREGDHPMGRRKTPVFDGLWGGGGGRQTTA